jgi:hypothetical protein
MIDTDSSKEGWKVQGNQIVPVNDLRRHLPASCWCRPSDEDGIIVHHSLDRRELYETGTLKPS